MSDKKELLDDVLCDEVYLLREEVISSLSEITSYQKRFISVAEKTVGQLNQSFTEKMHDLERLSKKVAHVLEQSEERERALVKFSMRWLLILGAVSLIGIIYWVFLGHQIADRRAQLESVTTEIKHTPTIIPADDDDYIRIVPDSEVKVDRDSPLDGLYAKVDYP